MTFHTFSIHVKRYLSVVGARVQDTAEYTCVADNGLDTDEHTAAVVIKGKARSS